METLCAELFKQRRKFATDQRIQPGGAALKPVEASRVRAEAETLRRSLPLGGQCR
jgi:hypothetical protein